MSEAFVDVTCFSTSIRLRCEKSGGPGQCCGGLLSHPPAFPDLLESIAGLCGL